MSEGLRFDEMLDEVLRERLGGAARAGLHRRVIAVLVIEGRRGGRGGWRPRVLAWGAASLLVLLVVALQDGWRTGEQRAQVGSRVRRMDEIRVPAARAVEVRRDAGAGDSAKEEPWRRQLRRRRVWRVVPAGELGGREERLEIPALTVAPLGVRALRED